MQHYAVPLKSTVPQMTWGTANYKGRVYSCLNGGYAGVPVIREAHCWVQLSRCASASCPSPFASRQVLPVSRRPLRMASLPSFLPSERFPSRTMASIPWRAIVRDCSAEIFCRAPSSTIPRSVLTRHSGPYRADRWMFGNGAEKAMFPMSEFDTHKCFCFVVVAPCNHLILTFFFALLSLFIIISGRATSGCRCPFW